MIPSALTTISKSPDAAGMHQTIRIQAEAALEGNQSSVDALFLFLLPEGLYLDDYELERIRWAAEVRIYSFQDSAPYEQLIPRASPSNSSSLPYTVHGIEFIDLSPSCTGCPWKHSFSLPVHLQYHTAAAADEQPWVDMELHAPYLFLRTAVQAGQAGRTGRCLRRTYLGHAPARPPAGCADTMALLSMHHGLKDIGQGRVLHAFPSTSCAAEGSCPADQYHLQSLTTVYTPFHHTGSHGLNSNGSVVSFRMHTGCLADLTRVRGMTMLAVTAAALALLLFLARITRRSLC